MPQLNPARQADTEAQSGSVKHSSITIDSAGAPQWPTASTHAASSSPMPHSSLYSQIRSASCSADVGGPESGPDTGSDAQAQSTIAMTSERMAGIIQ